MPLRPLLDGAMRNMPDPSIAFCVRVTHQPSSPAVNAAAREALGGLLTRLGEGRAGP